MRSEIIHRNRGRLFEGHTVGHGEHLHARHTHMRRVAAEACDGENPLADLKFSRGFRSEGVDRAGDFVADHTRFRRRVGIHAEPRHDIREVYAAGFDRDAHFADCRLRVRRFPGLQHVITAVFSDECLLHDCGACLLWIRDEFRAATDTTQCFFHLVFGRALWILSGCP